MELMDIAIILFMFIVIALLSLSIIIFKKDSVACISNPIQYGIDGIGKASGGYAQCSCFVNSYQTFFYSYNPTNPNMSPIANASR